MATTLLRILKYGFQSFWRNGWLSTATVLVMVLALITLILKHFIEWKTSRERQLTVEV